MSDNVWVKIELPKEMPKVPKMPKVNVFYLFYDNRNSL